MNKIISNQTAIMNTSQYTNIQKLTISALIIAIYCIIMYFTQSISFGPYQIRIATSLYALSYLYPFLVLPLGIANLLSNMLGGLGIVDMLGGCFVGILTAYLITLIRYYHLPRWLCIFPIVLIPGTIVPIWLSIINSLPYGMLVISLSIGQIIPSIFGLILIRTLPNVIRNN
ncbi:QueT transporter family protein [Anaeromicropila herbilytica]|uniref:QueT transporter family protein n=1 Tax=Anaeromicropila herbilytica TaxID=2785025 RepID=A0A7R7EPM6_9FIRM|nr:QueT transporter family protein [Anaeromicropila herbilytica]BCN32476.1 hypothetical protein bsdtb5_37710 [Anaeromicropila herbilytica]